MAHIYFYFTLKFARLFWVASVPFELYGRMASEGPGVTVQRLRHPASFLSVPSHADPCNIFEERST